jgi:hypothetical protein
MVLRGLGGLQKAVPTRLVFVLHQLLGSHTVAAKAAAAKVKVVSKLTGTLEQRARFVCHVCDRHVGVHTR